MEAEYYKLFTNATAIYKSPPSSPRCFLKPTPRKTRRLRHRSPAEGFWRGGNLHTKIPGATNTSFYNARQQTWEHSNNLVHHYKNLARINGGSRLPAIQKKNNKKNKKNKQKNKKEEEQRQRGKRSRSKRADVIAVKGEDISEVELEVETRQLAPFKPTQKRKEKLPIATSRHRKTEAAARYWSPTQSSVGKQQSKHKCSQRPANAYAKDTSASAYRNRGIPRKQLARTKPGRAPSSRADDVKAFNQARITPWSTDDSIPAAPVIQTVEDLHKAKEQVEEDAKYELDGFEEEQDYSAMQPFAEEPVRVLSEAEDSQEDDASKQQSMGANTNVATKNDGSTLDTYTLTLTAEDV